MTSVSEDAYIHQPLEARWRFNASSPLLRLPNELLSEIALILSHNWPPVVPHCNPHPHSRSERPATIGWILFGHTCHVLRSLILSSSTLWAGIALIFPGDAQAEIVSRAGSSPLTLSIGKCRCSHTPQRAQFMAQNLSRAYKISVEHCTGPCRQMPVKDTLPLDAAAFSGKEFPFLEEISIEPSGGELPMIEDEEIFDLPPISAPRLRRVNLRDIYVPLGPNLSSLTHLTLDNYSAHILPSTSQFLAILRSCIELQDLSLSYWLPSDLEDVADLAVSFPKLKTFFIRDNLDPCISFWSQLQIPRAAYQRVCLQDVPLQTDGYMDVLEPYIQNKINMPVRGVTLEHCGCFMGIKFSSAESSPLQPVSKFGDDFDFGAEYGSSIVIYADDERGDIIEPETVIAHTLQRYDIGSHLQYLCLSWGFASDANATQGYWCHLLSHLTRLHTLLLCGLDNHTILMPLTVIPPITPSTALLPALRFLWMDFLDLSLDTGTRSMSSVLLHMLSSRREAGLGLERIRIKELGGPPELVPALRAIVPRVETRLDKSMGEDDY